MTPLARFVFGRGVDLRFPPKKSDSDQARSVFSELDAALAAGLADAREHADVRRRRLGGQDILNAPGRMQAFHAAERRKRGAGCQSFGFD